VEDKPVQGVRCLQDTLKLKRNIKDELRGRSAEKTEHIEDLSKRFIKETIPGY
jgi:hypothetical protein